MISHSLSLSLTHRYDQYQQNNEEAQQDGEAEAENEGGRRKLENRGYVDCGTCESNGCWENMQNEQNGGNNGQNNGQITLEGMVEYVQQLSECQETGAMWNNMNLYSSFMCNDDGTGVEVAVFLDNECETYTSQTSYSALFPNDSYLYNSHSVVTYPFLNDIDCAEQMEWSSPEELYNQQQNGNQEEQQDNGEEPEANEFCRQLINEDLRPINDCNNNGQDDAEEEQEQNQNEEYDYFSSQVYDLTADQADDAYYLCKAVAALQSEGSGKINAKAKNPYNSQSSGHVYTYKKTKSSGSGSNGGKVAGIIIGLLAAAGVGFFVFQHVNKKKDDRKEPLVNDAAMA